MFGVSTYCLHREPLSHALDCLATITDCVEVMDDGLHFLETTELLENYSFRYFFHAPSRGVNIASLLEPIRRASVEVISQCFSLAGEVGAGVVVHPGYYAWEEERSGAERMLRLSLSELRLSAEEHSVDFFVENMGNWDYFFLRFPEDLEIIGTTAFALDVGHAHLNDCLTAFLGHPMAHVHLHDNEGREDTHSPVGSGGIDFDAVMRAVHKNHATPIIEVNTFEGCVSSIRRLEELQR